MVTPFWETEPSCAVHRQLEYRMASSDSLTDHAVECGAAPSSSMSEIRVMQCCEVEEMMCVTPHCQPGCCYERRNGTNAPGTSVAALEGKGVKRGPQS
jgi:hypothetical protein